MHFVTSMMMDERVGVRNLGKKIPKPTPEQAQGAVRRLDGKRYTEVVLVGEGSELTISGGNDGRYIAFISINTDEVFYNLLDAGEMSNEEVDVVTGGQLGSYSKRQVVTLSAVIRAAEEFFQTGKPSTGLTWEKQK